MTINHPNEAGDFYHACVNNYRGARTSGCLGLLCLTGVPCVKVASHFTVSNRMCPVLILEYSGPEECIAFQPVNYIGGKRCRGYSSVVVDVQMPSGYDADQQNGDDDDDHADLLRTSSAGMSLYMPVSFFPFFFFFFFCYLRGTVSPSPSFSASMMVFFRPVITILIHEHADQSFEAGKPKRTESV